MLGEGAVYSLPPFTHWMKPATIRSLTFRPQQPKRSCMWKKADSSLLLSVPPHLNSCDISPEAWSTYRCQTHIPSAVESRGCCMRPGRGRRGLSSSRRSSSCRGWWDCNGRDRRRCGAWWRRSRGRRVSGHHASRHRAVISAGVNARWWRCQAVRPIRQHTIPIIQRCHVCCEHTSTREYIKYITGSTCTRSVLQHPSLILEFNWSKCWLIF